MVALAETVTREFDPDRWVLVPTLHAVERVRGRELSPSADVPEVVRHLRTLAREARVLLRNDVWIAVGPERALVMSEMRMKRFERYEGELRRHLDRLGPSHTVYVITSEGCEPVAVGRLDLDELRGEYERVRFSGESRALVLAREGERALAVITVRPPKRRERRLLE